MNKRNEIFGMKLQGEKKVKRLFVDAAAVACLLFWFIEMQKMEIFVCFFVGCND
jgi:hypothetical protein